MSRPNPSANPDLHAEITAQIIQCLETGARPWMRPWNSGPAVRPIRFDSTPYHGVNVLLLWLQAQHRGYSHPVWMTFRQALVLGGAVRRGETGTRIVFAKPRDRKTEPTNSIDPESSEPDTGPRRILRCYSVFNLDQIDGLDDRYTGLGDTAQRSWASVSGSRIAVFATAAGARIQHGGDAACFEPGRDLIRMPPLNAFDDPQDHDAVLAHELVHWTGHATRLGRDLDGRFGSPEYAREELIAELGAAFLCADLAITDRPRDDHAAYIAAWLGALKDDKRLIFKAASQAEKAVAFLHGRRSP
ncbi:antirestriction protein ArdC [Brevundimonas sp. 1080]|uniref:ArdC family protein n=1 Tax=Brevundimonas sp. 1080 TaxID=3156405 RepID=UPI0033958835